jgi:hypothetical protein
LYQSASASTPSSSHSTAKKTSGDSKDLKCWNCGSAEHLLHNCKQNNTTKSESGSCRPPGRASYSIKIADLEETVKSTGRGWDLYDTVQLNAMFYTSWTYDAAGNLINTSATLNPDGSFADWHDKLFQQVELHCRTEAVYPPSLEPGLGNMPLHELKDLEMIGVFDPVWSQYIYFTLEFLFLHPEVDHAGWFVKIVLTWCGWCHQAKHVELKYNTAIGC